jgi:hypothetical protein
LPRAQAIATRGDRLVRTATPLLGDRQTAGVTDTTRNFGVLVAQLLRSDLPGTLRTVDRIAGRLDHLPATLDDVSLIARQLNRRDRLSRLLDGSLATAGELRRTQLIPDADQALVQITSTLAQSLAVQRQTLAATSATLDVARQTLEVARQTQTHAASIDNKFGGPLPIDQRQPTLLPTPVPTG